MFWERKQLPSEKALQRALLLENKILVREKKRIFTEKIEINVDFDDDEIP